MNLEQTKAWAIKAHGNQEYGGLKYSFHLQMVENILVKHGFGSNEEMLKTAWLHDILEDTDCTADVFQELFGHSIFTAVSLLTMKNITRKMRDYSLIAENKVARVVKLADRIANVEFAITTCNVSKMGMYLKEANKFKLELFFEDDNGLWARLDNNFENEYWYYHNVKNG